MSKTMQKLTILAPAKLNLHLAVLDRRPDGFHNIESLFLTIDLCDTLHFLPVNSRNSEIAMEWRGGAGETIPMEKNIIFKALSLFREKTGFEQGLQIRVEKRVPAGGGLGGGSSNAASTLLALNKMANSPLSRSELLEMAAVLGSDVPFFIHKTPAAWVTGRGEHIEPLEAPPWFFVLVNPGFPSDTGTAFRLLAESRIQNLSCQDASNRRFAMPRHQELNFDLFFNDFLSVFGEPEKSVYNDIIYRLCELGADYAGLSGAGATCFGVFGDRALAEKAVEAMRGSWGFVECCQQFRCLM